jgi:pyruvate-formate lyase-activating enzyme
MEHRIEDNSCYICEKGCSIKEGGIGACGRYTRINGDLVECLPNKYLLVCGISIETMPMLHYYPKGKFLQITTTGCNFNCPGCISTVLVKEMADDSTALQYKTPEEIILKAQEEACIGITFLMNDPLASYFTFLEVAIKAKKKGLLVGCSTNGYFTNYSANVLAPYLDFMNIGIKGFDDETYQLCGGRELQPVLDNIQLFYDEGIHIELSCMYKKGDERKVESLGKWVAQLDPSIPLQIMRYIPLENAVVKWEPTIKETEAQCRRLQTLLEYVYVFNSPGTETLHTYCPDCGQLLIERDFYGPMGAKVKRIHMSEGKCPNCGKQIPILGIKERKAYEEKGFEGGYPFTRALEIIEAMLIATGVNQQKDVVSVWETLLQNDGIMRLHHDIQQIDQYLESIKKFASYCEAEDAANDLYVYLRDKLSEINCKVSGIPVKPRVYYAMGKPLFALKGERFENQIVTYAGGMSVNKEIELSGRPGQTITVDELNALNPEVIFISSFLSNTVEDFYEECIDKGIVVEAVKNKRIYTHLYPNWDFGSPRWILGLMYVANILYPDLFDFNMMKEASEFYTRFYGMSFEPEKMNLSFGKPSTDWQWCVS